MLLEGWWWEGCDALERIWLLGLFWISESFLSSFFFWCVDWVGRVIYPHTHAEFITSGKTTDDIMDILKAVHLEYLPDREGGWNTVKEWRDVLSGGEKQRVRCPFLFIYFWVAC